MLIPEALSILNGANSKMQELGFDIVDPELQNSPKLPRLQTQLNDIYIRYYMLMQHIILNDDGDEIIGTIGQNDSDLNAILIDLQTLAETNEQPGAPLPRIVYVVNESGSGLPLSGSEGDLIIFDGTDWVNFSRGASGEVLVSTPTTLQWQSVVGNGIPSGGTDAQYLRKNSSNDYDVVWDTLSLSKVTDVTASAAEVNILSGVTASTTEINKLTGLTGSSLQNQLASKLSTSLASACIIIGSAIGVATPIDTSAAGNILADAVSGLTIKSGVITNTHVSGSAGIERSKLASGSSNRLVINSASGVMDVALGITADRVLISNSDGIPIASGVSTAQFAYYDATSSIQTQIDQKLTVSIAGVAQGDILYFNGSNWVNVSVGTNGQVLKTDGLDVMWGSAAANGLPSGGSASQYLRKVDGTDYNTEWHTFVASDVTDISASAAELNILSGATFTVAEANLLSGLTGTPLQTQLAGKLSSSLAYNSIFVGNGSGIAAQLGPGSNGQVFTMVGTSPQWQNSTPPGDVSGPASSTDRAVSTWNGVTGDALRDTSVIIDASNNITGVTSLSSGQIDILNQAELRLHETGSTNYVGIRASGTMAGNYTITLPDATPAGNTFLKYDGANYVWAAGGGGAAAFTDLSDVPSSYIGDGGKFVKVKVAEDGLEFVAVTVVSSVTGTADRITISGTGTDPVIDIASTYVGQASITTLGTVGTGTWNATNISLAKGGTGASLADPGADRIMFWDESANAVTWLSIDSTLSISGTVLSSVFNNTSAQAAVGGILGNTATINLTYNGGGPSITADVNTNSISNSLIRESSALSVIGRSANSTGDVADISAGSDHNILRRSGTSIGFGSIDLSQSGAVGSSVLPIANGGTGATSGAWLLAGTSTFSSAVTITGTGNVLKFAYNNLGVTQTNGYGLWLINPEPATSGTQQISPLLTFDGQGWKTDATAGSKSVRFAMDVLPVLGSSAPTGNFRISSSIDGAAYGVIFSISNTGISTFANTLTVSGGNNSITVSGTKNAAGAMFNTSGNITAGSSVTVSSYAASNGVNSATVTAVSFSSILTFTTATNHTGFYHGPTNPNNISGTHLAVHALSGSVLIGAPTIGAATTRLQVRGIGSTTGLLVYADDIGAVHRLALTDSGNLYGTAGTTGMTDGFFYIPSAAGVPSGTPTAYSNRVPMYYDSTNNDFYIYNGAWKKVNLS